MGAGGAFDMSGVIIFEVDDGDLIELTDPDYIPEEGESVRLNDKNYEVICMTWMLNPQRVGAYKFYPLVELICTDESW